MTNVLFTGCSFVHGSGLDKEKSDPNNFVNVFTRNAFGNCDLVNEGVPGNSNLRIFLDTCQQLIQKNYNYAFVCWTSYPRNVFNLGLEEYETRRSFIPNGSSILEHNGNDISFSSKFLNNLRDKLSLIEHPHSNIVDIVRYINILKSIADSQKTKIFFINNICQWDTDFFTKVEDPIPSNLTAYTNKLLNSDNRDDNQIKTLYNIMHNDYTSNGSIQENLWLNLYSSFKRDHQIDIGTDKRHPGPESHKNFGNFLVSKFNG